MTCRQIKLTGHGALLFGRNFGDVAVSQDICNLLRLTRVAAVHDGLCVSARVEHGVGELEECDLRESQQTSLSIVTLLHSVPSLGGMPGMRASLTDGFPARRFNHSRDSSLSSLTYNKHYANKPEINLFS